MLRKLDAKYALPSVSRSAAQESVKAFQELVEFPVLCFPPFLPGLQSPLISFTPFLFDLPPFVMGVQSLTLKLRDFHQALHAFPHAQHAFAQAFHAFTQALHAFA